MTGASLSVAEPATMASRRLSLVAGHQERPVRHHAISRARCWGEKLGVVVPVAPRLRPPVPRPETKGQIGPSLSATRAI